MQNNTARPFIINAMSLLMTRTLKMNKLSYFVAAFATTLLISSISEVSAQSQCDPILASGPFALEQVNKSEYAKLVLLAKFTKMDLSTANQTFAHEGQVGVGPLKIGPGTWNADTLRQDQHKVESSIDVNSIIDNQSSILRTFGDATIVDAWVSCINRSGGLSLSLKPYGDRAAIAEIIWYPFPTNANLDPAVIQFSAGAGNQITSGEEFTKQGAQLGIRLARAVEISRAPGAPVLVVLNTTAGAVHAYLPALPQVKPISLVDSQHFNVFCNLYEGTYEFTNLGPGQLQVFENCGGCNGNPTHGGVLKAGQTVQMSLNNGPTVVVPIGATEFLWTEIKRGVTPTGATCPP